MTLALAALLAAQAPVSPVCQTVVWPEPAPALFEAGRTKTVELPPIDPGLEWTEAVPSWNLSAPENAALTVEARVVYPDRATKYYSFGTWTLQPAMGRRGSVEGQRDEDGNVLTDTLRMKRPGGKLQLRLTGRAWPLGPVPKLERLFVSFSDTRKAALSEPVTKGRAWGKVLEPPRLAQGDYPNGKALCSPTCVSMILGHWAKERGRAALADGVSTAEFFVQDPVYGGPGNWSYNVAYAGSKPGMVGYCARLSGMSELETWIERGVPVACSVSWYLLHGRPIQPDEQGHLVVLVGFTESGEPVFNDPGDRRQVRKQYRREDFKAAWENSKRTVYVIYPREQFPDLPDLVRL